ncbi:hypothetical protein HL658_21990 [Azospirillum sp. RWY-5-1]|uniref:Flagellar hook-length control protein FliK n=1 Tax=Azospirillum oleiclasticum TaxID=2735135 RepID=A0ABX2TAJ4_9PROT|nr:hypothetical protein [Azospirillum oleiclasticum]NYZ21359.1 hypothetical protein [Azospirillum oleiclasticum]
MVLAEATVVRLPERLQDVGRAVVVGGTVAGETPDGLTRVRTAAGEVLVKSQTPLPADKPVTLQIAAGNPPGKALVLAQPGTGQAAAPQAGGSGSAITVLLSTTQTGPLLPTATAPAPPLAVGTVLPALVIAAAPRPSGASAAAALPGVAAPTPAATPSQPQPAAGSAAPAGPTAVPTPVAGGPATPALPTPPPSAAAPTPGAASLLPAPPAGASASPPAAAATPQPAAAAPGAAMPSAVVPGTTAPGAAPSGVVPILSPLLSVPPAGGATPQAAPSPGSPVPVPAPPADAPPSGQPTAAPPAAGQSAPLGNPPTGNAPLQPGPSTPSPATAAGAPSPAMPTGTGGGTPSAPAQPAGPTPAMPGPAATGPTTPQPSAPALAQGATVALRILSVTPPGSPDTPAPAAASVPTGAGGDRVVSGTIAGVTNQGQPILATEDGMLALNTRASAPPGTRITAALAGPGAPPVPAAATPPPADPLALATGGRDWPALRQVLASLGGLDRALAQSLVGSLLPQPNRKLGAALAFFLSAARGGDARGWLGAEATDALQRSGQGALLERLDREFREASQAPETAAGEWRPVAMPMLDTTGLHPIRICVRPVGEEEPEDGADRRDRGNRFLIDVELSRLGPMQLDGLVRENRFDLILRSHAALTPELRQELTRVFADSVAAVGFAGGLSFQSGARSWVALTRGAGGFGVTA